MKMLLSSAGITNEHIAQSIVELVGKPAREIAVLFVPTAANPIVDDKGWMIRNLAALQEQGYAQVDILDIAGLSREEWLPHFEAANLICFGGGNEQYLAKVMRESGVADALPELLKTKVYMGISAGSMVVGQFLSHELMKVIYPEEVFEELAPPLACEDLLFIPHLNSDYFTHVRKETLESLRSQFSHTLYACDDNSALKVIDGDIDLVGGGEALVFHRLVPVSLANQ